MYYILYTYILYTCNSLFSLTPNVLTYNALLCAVARSPDKCYMKTMLLILERMDEAGIAADKHTYSLLLEVMIETGHYVSLDAIFQNMHATGVVPTQKALRRLVVSIATNPNYSHKLPELLVYIHRNEDGTGNNTNNTGNSSDNSSSSNSNNSDSSDSNGGDDINSNNNFYPKD